MQQCFPIENICFTDIETNCEILCITTSVVSANMALSEKSSLRNLLLYIMVLITILTQKVHTYRINSVRSIAHVSETQLSLPSRSIETSLYAAKKQKKSHPVVPEFSRVLNVGQVKNTWSSTVETPLVEPTCSAYPSFSLFNHCRSNFSAISSLLA
jgi:hypothetical protein